MSESKVSYVSEILDGKVSRSNTCEKGLKQKGGNEIPYEFILHIYLYIYMYSLIFFFKYFILSFNSSIKASLSFSFFLFFLSNLYFKLKQQYLEEIFNNVHHNVPWFFYEYISRFSSQDLIMIRSVFFFWSLPFHISSSPVERMLTTAISKHPSTLVTDLVSLVSKTKKNILT